MKFGVNLINFGPSATPEILGRWARLAEDLGYHFLMTSDHIAMTADVQARLPGTALRAAEHLGLACRVYQPHRHRHLGAHPALSQPAGDGARLRQYRTA